MNIPLRHWLVIIFLCALCWLALYGFAELCYRIIVLIGT